MDNYFKVEFRNSLESRHFGLLNLCVYSSLWFILKLINYYKNLVRISILLSYLIWLNEFIDTFSESLFALLINFLFMLG